jgi:hypothetical protein
VVSRRALLAGSLTLGTVGALSGGTSVLLLTDRNVARENTLAGSRMDLKLAWREYHNGDDVDTHGTCDGGFEQYVQDDAPAVELDTVEPGDHGTLVVCARTRTAGRAVWARLATASSAEHGRQPLEEGHGDQSPTEGELDRHLQVTAHVADDCGLDGVRVDGGPLEQVASENAPLGAGMRLGTSPDTCLVLEWRLPESVPPTVLSDSVRFGVEFAAAQTRGADGSQNPWGGGS